MLSLIFNISALFYALNLLYVRTLPQTNIFIQRKSLNSLLFAYLKLSLSTLWLKTLNGVEQALAECKYTRGPCCSVRYKLGLSAVLDKIITLYQAAVGVYQNPTPTPTPTHFKYFLNSSFMTTLILFVPWGL